MELLDEFKMTAWRIEIDWDCIDGKKKGLAQPKKEEEAFFGVSRLRDIKLGVKSFFV